MEEEKILMNKESMKHKQRIKTIQTMEKHFKLKDEGYTLCSKIDSKLLSVFLGYTRERGIDGIEEVSNLILDGEDVEEYITKVLTTSNR